MISEPKPFPVVAFGASAGGIEAFSDLLKFLPVDNGMAYVLVMHLSRGHKSSLAAVLQKKTSMAVFTVEDGMEVSPDSVYVIPSNAYMTLVDGHFELSSRNLSANGNFAVDYFLLGLASTYKSNSIGVVLSGAATDGTIGLKAIKAAGGITFAQDESAEFSGMPKSAYDSGYADYKLPPEKIAYELQRLGALPFSVVTNDGDGRHEDGIKAESETIRQILQVVNDRKRIDFQGNYKSASIYRRVQRRVILNGCANIEEYYSFMKDNDKEVDSLYNDFLINVTDFFRDPEFFLALSGEIFTNIVSEREASDPIRIWIAGCATGEEAYSVAIALTTFLESRNLLIPFQIFASDLDPFAIQKARLGVYAASTVQHVPPLHVRRFFRKIDGHYQIAKSIRESCIFSQHDLLIDPPFSRIDLISCQNVLIYLKSNAQEKVLASFHYAMRPTGFMFLGKSETVGLSAGLFKQVEKRSRLFRRSSNAGEVQTRRSPVNHERDLRSTDKPEVHDSETDIERFLLSRYVQPSLLVNEALTILQFFGHTTPFLEPASGKATLQLMKMIRHELVLDLKSLIRLARRTGKTAGKDGVVMAYDTVRRQKIKIEVIPRNSESGLLYLIVFTIRHSKELTGNTGRRRGDEKHKAILQLEEDLIESKEAMRITHEEYESTYEELQAYNEEVLSTNEELQSVNEELETSKEELQSSNEELSTINDELSRRNVELKETQNYAEAIVDTVNNPFLIITSNLQIRSANRSFYRTFQLDSDKCEGHFLYEVSEKVWDIPQLREALNQLFKDKNQPVEFELQHFFPGVGEFSFLINAYRFVKGVAETESLILLAFTNLTELAAANRELKRVNDHLSEFVFIASHDLQEPLRKISIFSNYLNDHSTIDETSKNYLSRILGATKKMSIQLKDLIIYSFLLNRKKIEVMQTPLNTIVAKAIKDVDAQISTSNSIIAVSDLPVVAADPVQATQVFISLIKNAITFNINVPSINIFSREVTAVDYGLNNLRTNRKYFCVVVKDNGIGFNQELNAKIFVPFQRLNQSPAVSGSGMGLTIARKIMEDHGGAISATGVNDQGAEFSLFFPVTAGV